MKGISLFSNVGIAETYLDKLGVEILLANELSHNRCRFYSCLYPSAEIISGDIKTKDVKHKILNFCKKINVDFIMATPPCQGMSTAGKKDPYDPRNHLITDTIDLILNILPKYVFLENVPEQLITRVSYKNDRILIPEYIKIKLMNKYIINDKVLNAKDFSVPQSRKRSIFLLTRRDQEVKWDFPEKENITITLKDSIGHLPSLDPLINDITYEEQLKIFPDYERKLKSALKISPYFKPVSHVYRQVKSMIYTPTGKSAFENPEIYKPKKKDGSYIKGFKNTYKRMSWDKPSNTITTYNRTISSQENVHPGRLIGSNNKGHLMYSDPRVLTLYEIFILFSLPKKWNVPTWASENFIRTVIGEGIPPLMVKKIFKKLIDSTNEEA